MSLSSHPKQRCPGILEEKRPRPRASARPKHPPCESARCRRGAGPPPPPPPVRGRPAPSDAERGSGLPAEFHFPFGGKRKLAAGGVAEGVCRGCRGVTGTARGELRGVAGVPGAWPDELSAPVSERPPAHSASIQLRRGGAAPRGSQGKSAANVEAFLSRTDIRPRGAPCHLDRAGRGSAALDVVCSHCTAPSPGAVHPPPTTPSRLYLFALCLPDLVLNLQRVAGG